MDAAAERRARIVSALDADPGLTHAELGERTALPGRHLVQLLWVLEQEGRVVHEGRRWYPAPDGGPPGL